MKEMCFICLLFGFFAYTRKNEAEILFNEMKFYLKKISTDYKMEGLPFQLVEFFISNIFLFVYHIKYKLPLVLRVYTIKLNIRNPTDFLKNGVIRYT